MRGCHEVALMADEIDKLAKRGPSSLLVVQHARRLRPPSILHCLSNPIDSPPRFSYISSKGGLLMALLLAFYLICSAFSAVIFSSVTPASAADNSQTTAATVIKADVLYWEEGELIVKEFSGREERLQITPETKIEGVAAGRLKTGDRIVAHITDDRRALVITLQVPDGGGGFGGTSGAQR